MTNGLDEMVQTLEQPQAKKTFKQGNGRVMEPMILDCSEVFDPEARIDIGWSISKEDERTARLLTVDFSVVEYTSHLKPLERSISGWMKRSRIKRSSEPRIPLGVRHFWALLQDYDLRENFSVLEYLRLHHPKRITCIDFFGTILMDPEEFKRIACVWYEDRHWKHNFRHMSRDSWHKRCKSAALPAQFLQS